MELIAIAVLLPANYLAKRKTGRTLNYLSAFSAIWLLMVGFSRIRLFNLNKASEQAYAVVCIGAVFYAVSYIVALMGRIDNNRRSLGNNRLSKKYIQNDIRNLQDKEAVNMTVFIVVFVLVFLLQMVFLRRALAILASGDLHAIHRAVRQYNENGIYTNNTEKYLNFFIIQPFLYASIPISILALFGKIRHGKLIFALTTVLAITFFFTHAGRIIILDYIFYFLFSVQIFKATVSRKVKRRISYVIIAAFFGMVVITASRRGMDYSIEFLRDSFFKEIYDYFAIPIPQLSYWMERLQANNTLTYGIGFFNGIIELPLRILHSFGLNIDKYNVLQKYFSDTETYYTHAAYFDRSFNAFVTCFYFFFADFSYVGVVLGSCAFGVISGLLEKRCLRNTFLNSSLYLMFLHNVVRIFARWSPYQIYYIFCFIYLLIICKRISTSKASNSRRMPYPHF